MAFDKTQMDHNRYVASETAGNYRLGQLMWYSVGELEISQDELLNLAVQSGLPKDYLPLPIRPVDAFRRATSEAGNVVIRETNQFTETLIVRQVASDKDGVTRHIIQEQADKNNKILSYHHVGEFYFHRETNEMRSRYWEETATGVVERAETLYEKYRRFYTADHIRRMIKTMLQACQSVPLRTSGAVYFLPREYEQDIQIMSAFLKSLPGNAIEIHTMPVVDMIEQREMLETKLRQHIEVEVERIKKTLGMDGEVLGVKQELQDVIGEYAGVLRESKEVPQSVINKAVLHLRDLTEQVKKYETLLERNLSEVQNNLDIVRQQVATMLDRVQLEPAEQGKIEFGCAATA